MSTPDMRLLIIDDDENYREVLARSLARKDFDTRTAGNSQEALQVCEEQRPALILLDLNLNGQSGLNLIQPLLQRVPGARIVILTGYASITTTVTALKLGASHYLPKPARVSEIIKALLVDEVDVPPIEEDDRLSVRHLEWEYIQRTLDEHGGNISATAQALKMHRRTLQRKLNKRRPNGGV